MFELRIFLFTLINKVNHEIETDYNALVEDE